MRELARGAMEELRAVVFELRPASLEAEGLPTVLRKHVDVLRRVSGRPIELSVADPPRLPGARAAQVFRIAQEALQNALRHAEAEHIEVRLEGNGNGTLVLSVADDGRGFDPARRAVRGRRLGLTSMEERAEELGGTLAIDSTVGRGDARAAGGGRVIRVLIADDHAVVRQGLRTFLDLQADIDVVGEAADGEEAVAAAAEHAPDVILLDLVMPRLDGIGALRRLRETAPGRARDRADQLRRGRAAVHRAARGRESATCSRTSSPPSSCARSAPRTPAASPLSPAVAARRGRGARERGRRAAARRPTI